MSGVDYWTVAVIAAWLRQQDGHGEWSEAADAIDQEFLEGTRDGWPEVEEALKDTTP